MRRVIVSQESRVKSAIAAGSDAASTLGLFFLAAMLHLMPLVMSTIQNWWVAEVPSNETGLQFVR